MRYWKNPEISYRPGKPRNSVFADGEPISQHWESVARENLLGVGPFPALFHYPGTYILYLLRSPESKDLFVRLARGEKIAQCPRCQYREGGEPCCAAAGLEDEWWDEEGVFIGPEEYDPETGWEDIPDCQCKCRCLTLPVFQNRRAIGGPGTLDLFWQRESAKYLVAAVQYVASDEDKDLVITHMHVAPEFQRNRINSFMVDQLVEKHPDRELYFHDLTNQGRAFMDSYGGQDFEDKA